MVRKKKEFYSEFDQLIDREKFLETFRENFREIKDPRSPDNQTYPLIPLLIMILCAMLAGANTITDIYEYAHLKIEMFNRLFLMEEAPSYNVFWWLLSRLNPKHLESCFVSWIQSLPEEYVNKLIPEGERKHVAIDGKHVNGVAGLHLVSAWDSHNSLLLGQVKASEKSNEITAIPELLDKIDIKGALITIDAAGCQVEIIKKIREKGGHYLVALKRNQGILYREAEDFFLLARTSNYEEAHCEKSATCEKGHGRIEQREAVVTSQLDWLDCKEKWQDLASLIEIDSQRTVHEKTTNEKRYYISDLTWDPKKALKSTRMHWSIENQLHWSLDVNFNEDAILAGTGYAAENLAILRRLTSTLIRMDLGGVVGIAKRRRQAAWDDSWTLRLLSGIFKLRL